MFEYPEHFDRLTDGETFVRGVDVKKIRTDADRVEVFDLFAYDPAFKTRVHDAKPDLFSRDRLIGTGEHSL